MTALFNSPGGNSPTVPFTSIGNLGWDFRSSNNVYLRPIQQGGPFLSVSSGPDLGIPPFSLGNNQGSCIDPTFAQSVGQYPFPDPLGSIYWEILWTHLVDKNMEGGIGIGQIATASKVSQYGDLAQDGTGGVILRPNGDVWAGGELIGSGDTLAVSAGDVVGILANFNLTDPVKGSLLFLVMNGGPFSGIFQGGADFPLGNYVPVVVFDSEISKDMRVVANFGLNGKGSFLGPTQAPDAFVGLNPTFGWPNTL